MEAFAQRSYKNILIRFYSKLQKINKLTLNKIRILYQKYAPEEDTTLLICFKFNYWAF